MNKHREVLICHQFHKKTKTTKNLYHIASNINFGSFFIFAIESMR